MFDTSFNWDGWLKTLHIQAIVERGPKGLFDCGPCPEFSMLANNFLHELATSQHTTMHILFECRQNFSGSLRVGQGRVVFCQS